MKIFYNKDGFISGSIDGLPEIEAAYTVTNCDEMYVTDPTILARFRDENDKLEPHLCKVVNGALRIPTKAELNAIPEADLEVVPLV